MTSDDAQVYQPLPTPKRDRSAYHAALRDLAAMVRVDVADEPNPRYALCKAISVKANESVPEEWFVPLVQAAILEPDPSFGRQLVGPAMAAFGRRRVKLAILDHFENGTSADAAGAAKAWYHTHFRAYAPGYTGPRDDEECLDLGERYVHAALRRFVAEDDLDMRRCILPGLPLDRSDHPAEMHGLVDDAVRIARTSDDDYLRHRVEVQVRSGG
jgi:hypothetical protein